MCLGRIQSSLSLALFLGTTPVMALGPETLYSFHKGPGTPSGTLIQGVDGNFYGTTLLGGEDGEGSVFRMTPIGTITTLVSFTETNSFPASRLVWGSDGNMYGVTSDGGSSGWGTIFRVGTNGALTTLQEFN